MGTTLKGPKSLSKFMGIYFCFGVFFGPFVLKFEATCIQILNECPDQYPEVLNY